MVYNIEADLKSIEKTATGRILFINTNDVVVLSLKVTDQIEINLATNKLFAVVNGESMYVFTVIGLIDIDGKPYTALSQPDFDVNDYILKVREVYEYLNSTLFVSCCTDLGTLSVRSYPDLASFPATGVADVIYIAEDTNYLYRWDGAAYVQVGGSSGGFVPYTGATGDVDLGAHGLITDYVKYNTSPASTLSEGQSQWNDTDGTLDIRLKGNNVTLQVGQEEVIRVVNKTGGSLLESDYQAVRNRSVSEGGASGQRLAVVLAQADTKANHTNVLGLVTENISNNQQGFVTAFGMVNKINTTGSLQGETWVDGDVLYLSDSVAGGLTNVEPATHPVQIGFVVYAHAVNGKIFVKIEEGVDELHELHDVEITSPLNNQALVYESASGRWENKYVDPFIEYLATLSSDANDLNVSITGSGYVLLSPSTNVKITGLVGGSDGLNITLINTSASYTILIENNTTSSSAGNRFFNPGGEYLILLPGESLTFYYYNNQWNSAHLPFEQQLELFSDLTGYATGSGNFTNGAYFVDGPWRFLGGGTTPTSNVLPRPVTNQKKGVVTISMSRSPTVFIQYGSPIVGLAQGGVADSSAGTTRIVNCRFTIGDVTLNAATQNIYVTMGVANGSLLASGLGAYWSADATYANWQCVTDIGPTSTITDSGLPVVASVTTPPNASEYYTLGVVVHRSNGVSVSNAGFFSVNANGVITWNVREVNTNIPTTGVSPTLQWNGGGTLVNTTPNIYIDYLGYKIIGGSR